MIYKSDWEKAQNRMKAWWAGEIIDRTAVQVIAPRSKTDYDTWRLWHNIKNPEKYLQEFENYCRNTFFGGEAFPFLFQNLGPGITASYIGCEPLIGENSVWFEVKETLSWNDILGCKLENENKWWKLTKALTVKSVEYNKDNCFTAVTDLNSVLNILASLRRTEKLLIDLIDNPEKVKKASYHILKIWHSCYDELYSITHKYLEGCITWMGIWFPGKGSDVQCDFSAMISPRMFEEFVLPHLQEQCRKLDYTIYHWDGPGQIPHLDLLLDIPELNGIQWVPGEGNPDVGSPKWFPLYKRIQEKKKLLILQGIKKQDIENLMNEISSEGLLISTSCDSEEEARILLKKVEQWTRKQ